MHPVKLMEKRIDNAMTARDNCKPDSWGDNYWSGVIASLLHTMNRYLSDEQSKIDRNSLH